MMIRIQTVLFLFLATLALSLSAQTVERVEPPFWWTGMHNPSLQLLIYGDGIGTLTPSMEYNGVAISHVHTMPNDNYLFLDLIIGNSAKPGKMTIRLSDDTSVRATIEYDLFEREPGSAMRQGFNSTDVLYLITPDRFANGDETNDELAGLREGYDRSKPFGRHGGDVQGIIDHLDYIRDMGFTSIWLNPILENDQPQWSYHGYATTDYYKVDPRFGTNEQYRDLSRKAREMGIGMIMDVIVNHCGHKHWWMDDLPSDDWINNVSETFVYSNHRKSTLIDPYVSPMDRRKMVEGWFVEEMPDLNQNNPFMSRYLIQNSIWWIEYLGLEGLRQDTYPYPFRDFMTDWTCDIMAEYPNFNIVGEEWVDNHAIVGYWQRGAVNRDGYTSCLPSLMDFPMRTAVHKGLTEDEGWSTGLNRIYENLGNDFVYPDPWNMVIFPDNHDMSRVFTQVDEDYDLYKMVITYYATMRGIPQIYYGTEILMSNPGTDSHGIIRSDFPGGWKGDQVSAFTGNGLSPKQKDAQAWMKKLLNWRKGKEVIHSGKLMHFIPHEGVYAFFRYNDDETVMVVFNKSSEARSIDADQYAERLAGFTRGRDVTSGRVMELAGNGQLPPKSCFILELMP